MNKTKYICVQMPRSRELMVHIVFVSFIIRRGQVGGRETERSGIFLWQPALQGCPSHVLRSSVYLEGSLFFISSPYLVLASGKGQACSIMLSINVSYL